MVHDAFEGADTACPEDWGASYSLDVRVAEL